MKTRFDDETNTPGAPAGLDRRSFFRRTLSWGSAALLTPFLVRRAAADESSVQPSCTDLNAKRASYWREGGKYFVQENVDASGLDDGIIRARVDGRWQTFKTRTIAPHFFDYNIAMRLKLINLMMGGGSYSMYNDAHNAAVASYGANRGDSRVTINNAYKGFGWVPKQSHIKAMADEYAAQTAASMMNKVAIIKKNYQDKNVWRMDLLGSLELYTTQEFETHTFLNMMENPVASVVTLADESHEFRAIVRLIHPENPYVSAADYELVRWINFAHDFFHGSGQPLTAHRIGAIYHIVEQFDNSPWGSTATAGGLKVVPKM